MNEADKPRLAQWLTGCAEVYDRPISEAGLGVWWGILSHFRVEDVDRAFKAHVADPDTGRRMPTPADVVARIAGGSEAAAAEAWSKVLSVSKCGWSRNVVFDDSLIHAAIASVGGWVALCQSAPEDMNFRRRDFVAAYKGFRQRSEHPEYLPVMLGKYPMAPVTLVGNPERARKVFGGGKVPEDMPRVTLVELAESIDATAARIMVLP
jgi:hypothetical protein